MKYHSARPPPFQRIFHTYSLSHAYTLFIYPLNKEALIKGMNKKNKDKQRINKREEHSLI